MQDHTRNHTPLQTAMAAILTALTPEEVDEVVGSMWSEADRIKLRKLLFRGGA